MIQDHHRSKKSINIGNWYSRILLRLRVVTPDPTATEKESIFVNLSHLFLQEIILKDVRQEYKIDNVSP